MTDSQPLSTLLLEDLSITPGEVVEGDLPGAKGVVRLASPASQGVDVGLSTDAPAVVYVPLTVSIPEGHLSGSFDIQTAVFDQPTSTTITTITATLGAATRQAKLVVYPRASDVSSNGALDRVSDTAQPSSSALVPTPQSPPTTISVGATGPLGVMPAPPAAWVPVCQPSFAGSLLSVLPALPFLALACVVVIYLSPSTQPFLQLLASFKSTSVVAGIGVSLVVALAAAVLIRYVFRGLSAETANTGVFGELLQRIADIDARLAAFVPSGSEPEMEAAFVRAHVVRTLIGDELEKPGIQWVLGTGYINMWRLVHRAEQALVECDSKAGLLATAVYDELRLTGSDIAQSPDLLAKLRLAMTQIDPAAATFVQPSGSPSSATAANGPTDAHLARAALRQVHQAIDTFRDDNWAIMVQSRNQLMVLLSACGVATLLLLSVAMSLPATNAAGISLSDPVLSAAVFYLVGATVGIFNRLFAEASSPTSMEDYGLTLGRLLITPVLAGLGAVGGVLAVALVLSGFGGLQPTSTAAVRSIPTLAQIFNLEQNVFGIVIAAAFGLTPHMLVSTLQAQADKLAEAIKSSNAQTDVSRTN